MKITDLLNDNTTAAQNMRELLRTSAVGVGSHEALSGIGLANSSLLRAAEQLQRNDLWRLTAASTPDWLTAVRDLSGQERWRNLLAHPSIMAEAHRAAELTHGLRLPDALNVHRSSIDAMSLKLARAGLIETWRDPTHDLWRDSRYLQAFTEASAIGNLFNESTSVTRAIAEASRAMMAERIEIGSLAQYRVLLDSAGLTLPRWPRMRPSTEAERRRRLRDRQRSYAEPSHVRRAKSLVHNRELTLRAILSMAMEDEYGEDWPDTRLPLCGCKNLLGRWKKGGGAVLDHADYFHYAQIVADAEHFATVFHVAFADPDTAYNLLKRAGDLRAASHHAREFKSEDLRDLRVVWRSIDIALAALDADWVWDC